MRQYQSARKPNHAVTQPPKKVETKLVRLQTQNIDSGSPEKTPKTYERRMACSASYVPTKGGPDVWVRKWIDYSSKYGLGYILSNGSVGVSFNDSTRIVSASDGESFQYIHKSGSEMEEVAESFSKSSAPSGLNKKLTLLSHF